jgi:NTE family protein
LKTGIPANDKKIVFRSALKQIHTMTTGVALSGGGARGIAHLGALKAITEFGITPHAMSGVSSGAILGALFCGGISPDEILEILLKSSLFRYLRPSWRKSGFLNMERFEALYIRYLPVKTFEELNVKLYVSAADLNEGKSIFFSKGELIKPIMASSCMPILFAPIKIEDKLLVDGGIINNLPVEPLLAEHNLIIGVHCNPTNREFQVSGLKSMIERTFHLTLAVNVKERYKYADIFIEPPKLTNYNIFDIKEAKAIFNIGYNHAITILREWEQTRGHF